MKQRTIFFLFMCVMCLWQCQIDDNDTSIQDLSDSIRVNIVPKSFSENVDTLSHIRSYLKIADKYKNEQMYNLAFDYLWEALLLADTINEIETLSEINHELGVLHNIFAKYSDALGYFEKSLKLKKQRVISDSISSEILCKEYFPDFVNAYPKNLHQTIFQFSCDVS